MKIQSVFVKELSQRVKFLQAESRRELQEELSALTFDITQIQYKTWLLENFVVSITALFDYAIQKGEGDNNFIIKVREALVNEIIILNPLLDPKNLYITRANTITLNKDAIQLIECESWTSEDDSDKILVFNSNDYLRIVENAKSVDHYVETEQWELANDLIICVRKFNKNLKNFLLHGLTPSSEEEVKFFIVSICIDNFQQLYQYLESDPSLATLSYNKVIRSLYDISIKYNPFLDVKKKDFTRANQNYKVFKEGSATDEAQQEITQTQIRQVLSQVPEKEILNLDNYLKKHIYGQDNVLEQISKVIRRAYSGLKNPKTPIASFFFYGGTSTGKTELAKVLAKYLTRSNTGLIKVACNTLVSSHNVHTLIGAPPGYVGYDEKGLLEKALTNSKFKVILFDEVEKAHPKLFDLIMDVLEEGDLLLANGNKIQLSDCILIFTSNIGQEEAIQASSITGFNQTFEYKVEEKNAIQESQYEQTLYSLLRPEFLARLTGKFYFKNLEKEDLIKVAEATINTYSSYLKKKKIKLLVDSEVKSFIVDVCMEDNKECHARDVRSYVEQLIVESLGDFIISLNLKEKDRPAIRVLLLDDKINFEQIIKNKEAKNAIHKKEG